MIHPVEARTIGSGPAAARGAGSPRRGGLSRDEERRLADRIAEGDCEARNQLVQANLGLVVRIAQQYVGRGVLMEDLVGEGNLGLIRAAEEFEPRFGTRFSTYATYWIKDSILSALMNTTATIRVPAHMVKLMSKWRRVEQSLSRAGVRPPSSEEVAAVLGLSAEQQGLIAKALHARGLRLESGLAAGSCSWSSDQTMDQHETPEAGLEADDERASLRRGLDRLDHRERTVLIWRYGLEDERPITLKEIGGRLGLTKEWVRRIATDAIRKLVEGLRPGSPGPGTRPRPVRPHSFPQGESPGPRPLATPSAAAECPDGSRGLPPAIEPAPRRRRKAVRPAEDPGYLARCG